jgi:hypothetical protein
MLYHCQKARPRGWACTPVIVADGGVQRRDAGSLGQHQMDRDLALTVLGESRPVAGHRLLAIDHVLVDEDKQGRRR